MGVEDDGPAGPVASLLVRGGAGAVPAWCISAGAVVLVLCCGAGAVLCRGVGARNRTNSGHLVPVCDMHLCW